jgi:biopolymer transport protein ExbD
MRRPIRNPLIWKHVRANRRTRHGDVNMVPVMNIFILLVPFLLVFASLIELAVVHATVTRETGQRGTEPKLGLIVEAKGDGLTLISRTFDLKASLARSAKVAGSGRIEFPAAALDQFGATLFEVKRRFPEEREISLQVDRALPYQRVIALMDAVREYRLSPSDPLQTLFPNIAFLPPSRRPAPQGTLGGGR